VTSSSLIRAELSDTDDSGEFQTGKALGLAGEELDAVLRMQPHGFSSHPPKGSVAMLLSLGASRERAVLLGAEHPDHRPRGLPAGATALYDASGNIIKLVGGGGIETSAAGRPYMLKVGTLTIEADSVVIKSSDINLGGTGGKPVAVEGTVCSDGATLVGNFATTVKAV